MEEPLLGNTLPRLGQQPAELRGVLRIRRNLRLAGGDRHRIPELPGQPGAHRRPRLGGAVVPPVQRVEHRQERRERPGPLLHPPEQALGLGGLRDLGIGQRLDGLHRPRGLGRRPQRPAHEERPALPQRPRRRRPHPRAEEAVAGAQVVVEEAERRAHRERMEPQRHLGELHRHRVLVHPVHAPLQHHPPDQVAVVELRRRDGPAAGGRVLADRLADAFDPGRDRGLVAGGDLVRLGERFDHPVGQVIHEAHEEVPGAHRRVADPEVEQPGGGVRLRQRRRVPFPAGA